MLQFDQNGHLFPYEVHDVSLDEFQRIFVEAFPGSETRKRLFDHYLDWVFDFQRDVFPYFTQWINGSFVTQKLNPRDMDFVTFLDGRVYEMKEKHGTLDQFWGFSNEGKGLDAYIVPDYGPEHLNFTKTKAWKSEWNQRYIQGRKIQGQTHIPKGYIQINFEKK